MADTTLEQYLERLVREKSPPLMTEEEEGNRILARERTLTMRLPVLVHWQLQRAAQVVGETKTSFAEELLTRAVNDAFTLFQESGHLPLQIDLADALKYFKETTRLGEVSEPGGEVELLVKGVTAEQALDLEPGQDVAFPVELSVNRKVK